MSTHSPEPWRITKVNGQTVLVSANGGRITYMDSDLRDANANLIVAAPKMLRLLLQMSIAEESDRLKYHQGFINELIAEAEGKS